MKPRKKSEKQKNKKVKVVSSGSGKTKAFISTSDVVQIIMAILTFLSLVGVILTLREMQKDRDTAYKPTILINPIDFQIAWNANGEEEWLSSLPDESNNSYTVNGDGSITGTIHLPVNIFPDDGLESFTVVNIGIGAAKDIYFKWDENNIQYLCDYLAECDPSKTEFCTFGESAAFSFDERIVVTDVDRDIRLMYMLPEAKETYTIPLPTAYSVLIHEIMKCTALAEPPHIILYAEYSDVQGKSIRDVFYVVINRAYYEIAADNSGNASYQFTTTLLTG